MLMHPPPETTKSSHIVQYDAPLKGQFCITVYAWTGNEDNFGGVEMVVWTENEGQITVSYHLCKLGPTTHVGKDAL